MYIIPLDRVYEDADAYALSLTRAVYTTKALLMDITGQVLRCTPAFAVETINPDLYGRWYETRDSDIRHDQDTLIEMYDSVGADIRKLLYKAFDDNVELEYGITIRGRNLVILTHAEIHQWEAIYGTANLDKSECWPLYQQYLAETQLR